MKQVTVLLALVILSITSFSQDIVPVKDGNIIYSGVVTIDSAKAGDLYSRAKNFLAHEYKSSKAVIQVDDKDGGQIVGKGNFSVIINVGFGIKADYVVDHTISIFVKDGKYKYEISELVFNYPLSKYSQASEVPLEQYLGSSKKRDIQTLDESNKKIISLIEDLKKGMSTPLTSNF